MGLISAMNASLGRFAPAQVDLLQNDFTLTLASTYWLSEISRKCSQKLTIAILEAMYLCNDRFDLFH